MSLLDDLPRSDTRSQWLSTTVADLYRQQDPQSAPPRAVELDDPKLGNPLGSQEQGPNVAPQIAQNDAAPFVAETGGGTNSVAVTAADPALPQPVMASSAGLVAPADQHVGSTSRDDAPAAPASISHAPAPEASSQEAVAPSAIASTVDLPTAAAPSVATPVSIAPTSAIETVLQSVENHIHTLLDPIVETPAPQSLIAGALDTVLDRLHAGASQPSSEDEDDDLLFNDLLDAAHADLIATATSLLGPFASQLGQPEEHDADQAFDEPSTDQTSLFDTVIQELSPAHLVDTVTANLAASHPSLTALLNHDFDPHHLLG